MYTWIRKALTKRRVDESDQVGRRVRVSEELPSDRFVLSIWLMILFFVDLVSLELVHMVFFEAWNQAIFDGIMLIIGGLIGALFGYMEE